jgi:WD40 repeat protein
MADTNAQKLVPLDPFHVTKYSSSNVKRGLVLASKLAQPSIICTSNAINNDKLQNLAWQCTHTISVPYKYMSSAVLSPDGKVLAVVDKWGTLNVWNLKTGKRLYEPFLCYQRDPSLPKDRSDKKFEEDGRNLQLEIMPDNQSIIITGFGKYGIRSWNLNNAKLIHSVYNAYEYSFNPEHGVVVYSNCSDGIIKCLNLNESKSSGDFDSQFNWIEDIALSSDGNFLAVSENILIKTDSNKSDEICVHSIKIWDRVNNQLLHTINEYTSENATRENTSIYISPDSNFLVSVKLLKKRGDDKFYTAKFWKLQTGELLYSLTLEGDDSIKFSNNGLLLARNPDGKSINIWQLETGKLLRTLHSNWFGNFATSPDSQILASSGVSVGGDTIEIWNLETGELLHTLEAGHSVTYSIKFRSDSQAFVTIDYDGTGRVWQLLDSDAEALQEPQHLEFKLASESRSPFLK